MTSSPQQGERYKITGRFARGGMSDLYFGEHHPPNAKVERIILKRLRPELQDDARYLRFFRTEAQIAMKLAHPNIVKVHDIPIIDGDVYLSMEFVDGKNLRRIFDRCVQLEAPMPMALALYVIEHVLSGLAYVHDPGGSRHVRRVIHRDIKPANILVSFAGEVKLTDFGIARADSATGIGTQEKELVGTATYLAPEQVIGEQATERSDLYSCGVVLAELLSGTRLFERDHLPASLLAVKSGERPRMTQLLPLLPADLCVLLERLLNVDARQRQGNAAEVEQALSVIRRRGSLLAGQSELASWLTSLFTSDEPPPPDDLNPKTTADVDVASDPLPNSLAKSVIGAEPLSSLGLDARPQTAVIPSRRRKPAIERGAIGVVETVVERPEPVLDTVPFEVLRPEDQPTAEPDSDVSSERRPRPTWRHGWSAGLGFAAGVAVTSATVLILMTTGTTFVSAPPNTIPVPALVRDTVGPEPRAPSPPPPASAHSRTVEPDGFLTILRPRHAKVIIDGVLVGERTPLRRHRLTPGVHDIRVAKKSTTAIHVVDIRTGQESRLTPRMRSK